MYIIVLRINIVLKYISIDDLHSAHLMTRVPVPPPSPGWSPLHYAASHGHDDVATLLVEAGADLNATNNAGETPLTVEATPGRAAVCSCRLPVAPPRGGTGGTRHP